jgi:hypothetical protein
MSNQKPGYFLMQIFPLELLLRHTLNNNNIILAKLSKPRVGPAAGV